MFILCNIGHYSALTISESFCKIFVFLSNFLNFLAQNHPNTQDTRTKTGQYLWTFTGFLCNIDSKQNAEKGQENAQHSHHQKHKTCRGIVKILDLFRNHFRTSYCTRRGWSILAHVRSVSVKSHQPKRYEKSRILRQLQHHRIRIHHKELRKNAYHQPQFCITS